MLNDIVPKSTRRWREEDDSVDNGARGTIKRGAFQIRQVPEKGRNRRDNPEVLFNHTKMRKSFETDHHKTGDRGKRKTKIKKRKQNSSHVLVYAERHSAKKRVVRSGEMMAMQMPTWAKKSESK